MARVTSPNPQRWNSKGLRISKSRCHPDVFAVYIDGSVMGYNITASEETMLAMHPPDPIVLYDRGRSIGPAVKPIPRTK